MMSVWNHKLELVFGTKLIINVIATLHEALIYMFEFQILSVPIYKQLRTQFSAFIDLYDILFYVKDYLNESDRMKQVLINTKCLDILSGKPESCTAVNDTITIQQAIDILSKNSVKRLAILDENGCFESVLSQSRLVRYLGNRPECDLGEIAQTMVGASNIGSSPVLTIRKDEKALTAFLTMLNNDIGGIAIVNSKDKVIGNISISDLRAIGTEGELCRKFTLTCEEFIIQNSTHRLVTVVPSDRFLSVLWHLRSRWVHRVYLISDEEKKECLRVIAVSDVLNFFKDKEAKSQ